MVMANVNLFTTFDKWTIKDGVGTEVTDSFVVSEDGYGCSYTITNEDSYLRYRISDASAEALRGHKLKLHLDDFSASDNKPWFQIRLYSDTANDIYESISLYYEYDGEQKELSSLPLDYEFTVPMDCVRLDFRFRHEYASEGIDPPAVMTISGLSLVDTYTESISTLNFHKVLKENLPVSVTPGSQHIYFALNGSIVEQYVSDKEGNLIQVTAVINDASIPDTIARKSDIEAAISAAIGGSY
jgi:hypothetical protein